MSNDVIIYMVIYMDDINKLIEWISSSKKVVFFGGAGVSTESGLKDFRSPDGLYSEHYSYPPEEILSHSFFINNTLEFYKFYKNKLNTNGCSPNITHYVLSEMERKGIVSSVITQNIDGFHQEAGSKNVLELHGSIKRNYCTSCGKFYREDIVFGSTDIPYCSCGGLIKPDVVLYEETLDDDTVDRAISEISSCDLLIIGGTSLNVYPAASFIKYFRGKHIVLINKEKTPYDFICDLVIHENIGNVFRNIKKNLLVK